MGPERGDGVQLCYLYCVSRCVVQITPPATNYGPARYTLVLFCSVRTDSSRCTVNQILEDMITSVGLDYDEPNGRDFFSCGDVILGRLIFDLSKETRVNSITLFLMGKAIVQWASGSKKYSLGSDEYFKIKCDIVQQDGRIFHALAYVKLLYVFHLLCNCSWITNQHCVYDCIGVLMFLSIFTVASGAGETVLRRGTHTYPFRMQLPLGNFPSSFQGAHGKVTYAFVVEIHRPWHFAQKYRMELKFVSQFDANNPQLLAPLSASKSKELCCLCCASGPVSMDVHLERNVYFPGEIILINAEFENSSSRTIIPRATLIQTQKFYTTNRSESTTVTKELVWVDGWRVMPHRSGVWEDERLQIPANAPPTISNCQILELEYSLRMRMYTPYGTYFSLVFPLVICSAPVDPPPA
ncbi:arrestin domain-containing protein 3-like isoform X2 [Conger conger]|uniref:arrestin domain-containing protein 3-like isoform X2 n=1 Tax=Conger conger TaxID=82655 RepID=UPI002A5A6CCB|nr:arrestin domain-containing protein 3-like isoform X2 [Conger conger]